MIKSHLKLILALICLGIYHLLFWQEKLGINLPIYSALLALVVWRLNPGVTKNWKILLALCGMVISGIGVVLFNSITSKVAHFTAVYALIGWMYIPNLKFVLYPALAAATNFLYVPVTFPDGWRWLEKKIPGTGSAFRWIRIAILPILAFFSFLIIYSLSLIHI